MSSPQRNAVRLILLALLAFVLLIGVEFGKGYFVGLAFGIVWCAIAAVGHDLTR